MATLPDTAAHDRWEKEVAAAPTRPEPPATFSGVPTEPRDTPDNLDGFDPILTSAATARWGLALSGTKEKCATQRPAGN